MVVVELKKRGMLEIVCYVTMYDFHLFLGAAFFSWYEAQQKSLNIAKELGTAIPDRSLMSRLKPNQVMDIFWSKLLDFERYLQLQCLWCVCIHTIVLQ